MFSEDSTIDNSSQRKNRYFGLDLTNSTLLRQPSRRKRTTHIFNEQAKIQIQQPLSQSSFPVEVQDYALDIINYVEKQQGNSIIAQNYLEWQTDINACMRDILVGWLIQVTAGLNLKHQTLHLAVLLLDKYCYTCNILKRKYQVLGGACLFIAAKYQEVSIPRLHKYVSISDGAYVREELLKMESQVLIALGFNLQEKSTLTFFDIKAKEYQIPQSVKDLCYLLLEMCLIEYQFCRKKPKCLALAVLYCGMKLKKKKFIKSKLFIDNNVLNQQTFTFYVDNVFRLYSMTALPKFSAVRKRYSYIFNSKCQLK